MLKADRKAAKTALSKKFTQIKKCIAELRPDYPQVLGGLRDEYIFLYSKLEFANSRVLEALQADEDVQEDDIDKHEAYTETIEAEYIKNLSELNKKLGLKDSVDVPIVVDPMQNAMINMTNNLSSMAESMNRPRVSISHFSGGPDLYEFLKSFDLAVGETSSYKYKLTVLNQFCKGEAQLAIRPCLKYQNEEEGYNKARAILKQRFGNPSQVAYQLIENLVKGPSVSTDAEIKKFSNDLEACKLTLIELNMTSYVSSFGVVRDLASRLSHELRRKFQSKAVPIEPYPVTSAPAHNDYPTFEDLCSFVYRHSQIKKLSHFWR